MSARPVPPGDFGALTGAEQLTAIPRSPADIPAGRVVVHNHVRPARRLGMRGFRAYLVQPRTPHHRLRLRVGSRAGDALPRGPERCGPAQLIPRDTRRRGCRDGSRAAGPAVQRGWSNSVTVTTKYRTRPPAIVTATPV